MQSEAAPSIMIVAAPGEDRATTVDVLAGQGYRLSSASHPSEAEALLQSASPDLIVCLTQDDDDSAALGAFIRQLSGSDGTEPGPLLVICSAPERLEFAFRQHPMVDVLQMPFDREELMARVRLLLMLKSRGDELSHLRARIQTLQKTETLGMLASGVAHELNNLMFSVLGFAEIALSEESDPDVKALKESAEVSRQVAKRAADVAGNLLAFSRQASGSRTLADVNAVINDAVKLVRRNMERSGVQIALSLSKLPYTVLAPGLMQQVFVNLILNAWHAMSNNTGKKEISITTACQENTRIVVTVSDTGPGIPEDIIDKIFEPFFSTKVSPVESMAGGGGMGLFVVRQVMRDHAGVVRVESEAGAGTRFTLVLPVTRVDDLVVPNPATQQDQPESCSVLIVDDEESTRKILARILLMSGHVAFSAANMAQAMPYVWGHKLDLIVMDLIMPKMDGLSAIRHLKNDDVTIPILICTGNADADMIEEGLQAGASGVIRKPFGPLEFLNEMRRVIALGREQALAAKPIDD